MARARTRGAGVARTPRGPVGCWPVRRVAESSLLLCNSSFFVLEEAFQNFCCLKAFRMLRDQFYAKELEASVGGFSQPSVLLVGFLHLVS